jgi:hypothetical protein
VESRSSDAPRVTGPGSEHGESEDALWVRSFLLTQPGKTYRIEPTDAGHEAAASEAVEAAARALTDDVVSGALGETETYTPVPDHLS